MQLAQTPQRPRTRCLDIFVRMCQRKRKRYLRDSAHPFPYANLEWPQGTRKVHGIRNAREPRAKKDQNSVTPTSALPASPLKLHAGPAGAPTQRVTAKDLERGQVRIPASKSAFTKSLFPAEKQKVIATVRGQRLEVSWDPRMGPDKERSGILRIGKRLSELVTEDEVLVVTQRSESEFALN
jgi:hypothetical protein